MDLITSFALGDDMAILLLGLAVAAIAVIVGAVVRLRSARAAIADPDASDREDAGAEGELHPELEPSAWLRSLITSGITLGVWLGVPVLLLSLLVVDALPDRALRAAMILLGLALGGASAVLGQRILLAGASIGATAEETVRRASRHGALQTSVALAVVALPAVVIIWVLRGDAGTMLLGLAAGSAVIALALRVIAATAESATAAAALLAGTHELELDRDDEGNLAAPGLRDAELLRHGAARSALLTAVAAMLVGVAVTVGITVLATEGILVAVLGLGAAMLAPLLAMAMPQKPAAGGEAAAFRLAGLVPTLVVGAATVAAAALWLPGQYKNLRFEAVGMGTVSDPNITGGQPTPRADLLVQVEQALEQLETFISSTDESLGQRAILDLLVQYTTHPNTLVAIALALGLVAAVSAQLLLGSHSAPLGGAVRRVARTSRTGASLGILSALATAALWTGMILAVLAIVLLTLGVISAGVPLLAFTLAAAAALGALIAVTAHAGVHAAEVQGDRPGTDEDWRILVRGGGDQSSAGLVVAVALSSLALLAPLSAAIQAAPRATTVWEDRALHSFGPTSFTVVAGIAAGLLSIALVSSFVLDAQRRLASAAVLEARTGYLDDRSAIDLEGLGFDARRLGLVAVVTALVMPVATGFALGPAAVLTYVATLAIATAAVSLWSHLASGTLRGAVPLIEEGRYGGRGSWAHGGALSGSVLGTSLRSGLGEVLVPAALVSTLISYLSITMVVGTVVDGTSVYLRAGIAVVALLVGLCCWLFAITAPEPDLEDGEGSVARPLFATRVEEDPEDGLLSMNWDAGEDDDRRAAPTAVPAPSEDESADDDEDSETSGSASDSAKKASGSTSRRRKRSRRKR